MFPLKSYCYEIPVGTHPGAFGAVRKYDVHTGVDLYCDPGQDVYAIEKGIVLNVIRFTGPSAGSPWWNDTDAVLVLGESGIILYGELEAEKHLCPGKSVKKGRGLGKVKTVLKKDKSSPMTMLHMELYDKKILRHKFLKMQQENREAKNLNFFTMFGFESMSPVTWNLNEQQPEFLLDITTLLQEHKQLK